jgi:hypothetical protein
MQNCSGEKQMAMGEGGDGGRSACGSGHHELTKGSAHPFCNRVNEQLEAELAGSLFAHTHLLVISDSFSSQFGV